MSHFALCTFIPGVKIARPDEALANTNDENPNADQI
jgi:hypothetical protein